MSHARHRRIGGTDSPKVLGVSKYGGPIAAYARIAEGKENDIDPFTAKRGRLLEPVIRELAADKYGWSYAPRDYSKPLVILDEKRDWCASSPDDLLPALEAGADFKSVDIRSNAAYGDEETDQMPPDALVQCAHYCAALNVSRWFVVAYFGGNDLRRYVYERDKELEDAWEAKCSAFWTKHIVPKVPPPVDGSESCLAWLMERRQKRDGLLVKASPEAEAWAKRLKMTRAQIAALEKVEDLARNTLFAMLGDGERMVGNGWSLGVQSRSSTSWKQLAESVGVSQEQVAKFTKSSSFPVWRGGKDE